MLASTLTVATLLLSAVEATKKNISSCQYDFIIVGGGTSGLVVANRLSEMEDTTVAVIEAGDSVLNNLNVSDVLGYSLAFGTSIDWAYQTENQTYAGGLRQTMRAGRAIGGTSTINGMSYTRAQDVQIDSWEMAGNDGWNWESLLPYYEKSEGFQVPTVDQIDRGANYDIRYHGVNGPLKVGWPNAMTNSSVFPILNETLQQLGIPYNGDVNGGKMVGLTTHPDTIDRENNVREDAARAYYWPYQARPNLKIISNTKVNKILWANNTSGDATAIGVEITGIDGVDNIYASKEVILSAGALKSPILLELSGVGNPSILQKYDIPVVVNLPTVGENLQDQTNNGLAWRSRETWTGLPAFSALPSIEQLYGKGSAAFASTINASLADYARFISNVSNGAVKEANLLDAFRIQYDLIFKLQVPFAEIVFVPLGDSVSSEYWTLLPFSRGSVHVKSANVSELASINPNYFMYEPDLHAQGYLAQYIRKIHGTAPLSGLVGDEVQPGLALVPGNASASTWESWVKSQYRSNFHPVGTASMLPREKGGVVSPKLKVYGTTNVRVVDASILPFQLCGHLTSTLYAVAEKASDLIKEECQT
ncbi:Glucose oxidase [Talaromyces pinophilus]|nr:Glucose oxidase [Talaromyces pinophilus]